jgi:hypothetical protein
MDVHELIRRGGGPTKVGVRLGVAHNTVSDWLRTGYIPGARLVQISRELGVPIEVLAPLVRPVVKPARTPARAA